MRCPRECWDHQFPFVFPTESRDSRFAADTVQSDGAIDFGEIDWAALLLATSGKLEILRGELENLSDI